MNSTALRVKFLREILEDRERGASQMARRCLEILAEYAGQVDARDTRDLIGDLAPFAANLRKARPGMAPVQNLLDRWAKELEGVANQPLADARQHAIDTAKALQDVSQEAVREIAHHVKNFVASRKTIITHSFSSTMLEVFRGLKDNGIDVIATESRPLFEGRKLAEQLSDWGIPVTLITDAQLGVFVQEADLALVGADSVLADRSIVNKVGTSLLALAARDHGVPFYVCCETSKFKLINAEDAVLEEMSAKELDAPEKPHIKGRNVYFDITPARLITGWITENGCHLGRGR